MEDKGTQLLEVGDGSLAGNDGVDDSSAVDKDGAMVKSLKSCTCWDGLVTVWVL